jgi:hypothetical protein
MEENIQKILNEKDENVVQFNVINTTSNPIFVDLFNSATLTPTTTNPVITTPANSPLSTIPIPTGIGQRFTAINPNNNQVFSTSGFTNFVSVYDENDNLITTINIGNTSTFIVYNPLTNSVYVATGLTPTFNVLTIIDCNTYLVVTTFTFPASLGSFDINTTNNLLYIPIPSLNSILLFDCNTFVVVLTIPLTTPSSVCSYNKNNNCIYLNDTTLSTINKIDCNTNTYIPLGISIPPTPASFPFSFNPNTNKLYGSGNISFTYFEIDTTTDTLTNLIPSVFGLNAISCAVDYIDNILYVPAFTNNLLIYDLNTNTLISNTNYGFVVAQGTTFSPNNRRMYISTIFSNLFVFTSVNVFSSTYFISGSANYNAFVNNLNNEPVFIQMVRLLVQNQDQLNNELQLTKIDSNGNQIFIPNFPINEVSAYQQQGNIGEITLKDIVFDGRTYINQYQLNAYETISFEIYYKQLDLTTATATHPIFFKPKVQLKEYIKNELNL